MKMNDILGEGGAGALDAVKRYGGPVVDVIKKMDPTQLDIPLLNKFYTPSKRAYSDEVAQRAKEITKSNADAASVRATATDKAKELQGQINQITATPGSKVTMPDGSVVPKKSTISSLEKQRSAQMDIANAPGNQAVALPDKDKASALRYTLPAIGANELVKDQTSTINNPEGKSLAKVAGDIATDIPKALFKAGTEFASGAVSGTDSEKAQATSQENPNFQQPPSTETEKQDSLRESLKDILKLSGQQSITERDNIAGIIKPKEIIALHESKQIDECGMMPSTPNTPATLNISATAGSGEEVANMLAAIMNLAGVKPVTGDMLGSAEPPMPIVKAIDIISKGNSDHKHDHDHDHEEPLIGMGEEYANTPEDPTKVPDLDTNQMAYQPNSTEPGDRMDGTMPKGFPTMTKESLYQAYNQFKNGQ